MRGANKPLHDAYYFSENRARHNRDTKLMIDESYQMRFGGIGRLYGSDAQSQLAQAHMLVVGLGGVGSWAAEALARSGIGELTLIELDDICVTNSNRQLHALSDTVGKNKLDVMAQRLQLINPQIKLHCVHDFLTTKNISSFINSQDVIIDAIDSANVKSALAAFCIRNKKRLICVGSSGGKKDPTQIRHIDLGKTEFDPLLAKVRLQLYRLHKFERTTRMRKFRVDAIYSTEHIVYAKPDGSVCSSKKAMIDGVKLDCASGLGSAAMITGTFGFTAAARAIERYLQDRAKANSSVAEH